MSDSSLEIKESILALASKSTPLSLSNIREMTNELVRLARDEAAQVDLIEDAFKIMTDGTEIMNEILGEALALQCQKNLRAHDGLSRAPMSQADHGCQRSTHILLL